MAARMAVSLMVIAPISTPERLQPWAMHQLRMAFSIVEMNFMTGGDRR